MAGTRQNRWPAIFFLKLLKKQENVIIFIAAMSLRMWHFFLCFNQSYEGVDVDASIFC